jgi:two-component system chemotaxis response regulator CheY/two-component system response regulator (stage 0 sporulation protein A)
MKIPRPDENNDAITAIVIDDDIDTVEVLVEFLAIKGINVIGKGYDGLKTIIMMYMELKPTVAFLDVMMQAMMGFTL